MSEPTQTQLQISSSSNFNTLLVDKTVTRASTGLVSLSESDYSSTPASGATLYTRARHLGGEGGDTQWSTVVSFTLKINWDNVANDSITIIPGPSATSTQWGHYTVAVPLVNTKALVCYEYSGVMYARVIDVNNGSVTMHSALKCNSVTNTVGTNAVVLSETKVCVVFSIVDSLGLGLAHWNGYGQILNISGNTITAGNVYTLIQNSDSCLGSAAKLTDNKIIVCYSSINGGASIPTQMLTISGNTITVASTNNNASHTSARGPVILVLDSNKVLLSYYTATTSGQHNPVPYIRLLTISGNSFTAGAAVKLRDSIMYDITMLSPIANKIVLFASNGTTIYGNSSIFMMILTISGSTITINTNTSLGIPNSRSIGVGLLDTKQLLLMYNVGTTLGDPLPFYVKLFSLQGNTLITDKTVSIGSYKHDSGADSITGGPILYQLGANKVIVGCIQYKGGFMEMNPIIHVLKNI